MKVGVLALQGSSGPHLRVLRRLGVEPREVRSLQQLDGLSHLILPGGESTTLHHLLVLFGMWEELAAAVREGRLCAFGTCAGAILLGREAEERPPRMGVLDAEVERNAYGRQIESFTDRLDLEGTGIAGDVRGVFIRAPRFRSWGPAVRVRARCRGEAVMLEGPGVLAASFHPELTDDDRIHGYFLEHFSPKGRSATPPSRSPARVRELVVPPISAAAKGSRGGP